MPADHPDEVCCTGKAAECWAEKCDIFDFMARHVGMTVIHPIGMAGVRLAEKAARRRLARLRRVRVRHGGRLVLSEAAPAESPLPRASGCGRLPMEGTFS